MRKNAANTRASKSSAVSKWTKSFFCITTCIHASMFVHICLLFQADNERERGSPKSTRRCKPVRSALRNFRNLAVARFRLGFQLTVGRSGK